MATTETETGGGIENPQVTDIDGTIGTIVGMMAARGELIDRVQIYRRVTSHLRASVAFGILIGLRDISRRQVSVIF